MLSTDREEFERQFKVLLAGVPNGFATPERIEAYWRGLQKMPLSAFIRVVDSLLQDGMDKAPSISAIWDRSRNLRSRATVESPQAPAKYSAIHAHAQKCLFAYLDKRGACSDGVRRMLHAESKRIVAQFEQIATADEVTGSEIRDALFKAWDKTWKPMTPAEQRVVLETFQCTHYAPDFALGAETDAA